MKLQFLYCKVLNSFFDRSPTELSPDFSLQTVLFNISIAFCSDFRSNLSGLSLDVP